MATKNETTRKDVQPAAPKAQAKTSTPGKAPAATADAKSPTAAATTTAKNPSAPKMAGAPPKNAPSDKEAAKAAAPGKGGAEAAKGGQAAKVGAQQQAQSQAAAMIASADGDGVTMSEAPRDVPVDRIARRAYELYEQRGREDGRDQDDWLRAERELRGGRASDPTRSVH